MLEVLEELEVNMQYLGVTGVEDQLQVHVAEVIAKMRESGMAVWMITGDKVETAQCIAISTGLKDVYQRFYIITEVETEEELDKKLFDFKTRHNEVLVIDGKTMNFAFEKYQKTFIEIASAAPAVVCCRVSPTQKTSIVEALKKYTNKRIAAIGDGGNDVGMIQAAHVGIGIVGKEGKQAALASDFSINEFQVIEELILWHGRLSYKRTAKLSHFVFHRGLIISFIQALFIALTHYSAIPLYNGYLTLGYATIFTMCPVLSLVLDIDIDRSLANSFPPLYKTLAKGRELNLTMFCIWVWKSIYQGSVIVLLGLVLFGSQNFTNMVAITFTSLILTEWLNIVTEIEKWHLIMIISEISSVFFYAISIFLLREYFDLSYIISLDFAWKVLVIISASWAPTYLTRIIWTKCNPEAHQKIQKLH